MRWFGICVIICIIFTTHVNCESYKEFVERTKIVTKPVNIKNVLIVGLSQSGKSSMKNFIIDSRTPSTSGFKRGFSITANPYVTTILNESMVINLIDTPGFAEILIDNSQRNSELLSEMIRNITFMELAYIHQIWMTIPLSESRISSDLLTSMYDVIKLFKGLEKIIIPIFTKCQMLNSKHIEEDKESWIGFFRAKGINLNWGASKLFGGLDSVSFFEQGKTQMEGENVLEFRRHRQSLRWRNELIDGLNKSEHRMSVYCLENIQENTRIGFWSWLGDIKKFLLGDDVSRCEILDSHGRVETTHENGRRKVDL